MVLLITHPDYMCFGKKQARDEFPVSHYEEFLHHVREKYEGSYWTAQPREVARYYCDKIPVSSRNTRKKICMLAYTNCESDNRVRRYAETLARRGAEVDVIALCGNSRQREKQINGITVSRIQNRDFNDRSKWTYASRLLRFLCRSSVSMARLHIRNRYDVIHVHNMPDFLVFAAWYPKLTGARLILDIHDIVPERFANEFKTRLRTAYVKLLQAIEKMSASFVDHVMVSNRLWRDTVSARSLEQGNCFVNGHGLRQTPVTRRYRHAGRNSWDQKNQEYLNLVDSLSTERFDSVQPPATIDFGLPESHPRQTNASPMPKEIGQLAIKLQRSSTASASKIE
jgi:hypothetical protein